MLLRTACRSAQRRPPAAPYRPRPRRARRQSRRSARATRPPRARPPPRPPPPPPGAGRPPVPQRRPAPRPLRRILAEPGRGSSPISGERAAGQRSRARATARRSCALARAAGARPCPCSRCRRAWRGACATRGAWSTTSRPPLWPAWQRWVRVRARHWAAEQETQVSLRTPSPSAWQRRSLGRAAQQAMQILLRMWPRAALTMEASPRVLPLSAGFQPGRLGVA